MAALSPSPKVSHLAHISDEDLSDNDLSARFCPWFCSECPVPSWFEEKREARARGGSWCGAHRREIRDRARAELGAAAAPAQPPNPFAITPKVLENAHRALSCNGDSVGAADCDGIACRDCPIKAIEGRCEGPCTQRRLRNAALEVIKRAGPQPAQPAAPSGSPGTSRAHLAILARASDECTAGPLSSFCSGVPCSKCPARIAGITRGTPDCRSPAKCLEIRAWAQKELSVGAGLPLDAGISLSEATRSQELASAPARVNRLMQQVAKAAMRNGRQTGKTQRNAVVVWNFSFPDYTQVFDSPIPTTRSARARILRHLQDASRPENN